MHKLQYGAGAGAGAGDGDGDGDLVSRYLASYLASYLVPRLVPRDREFTQDRKSSHPEGGYGFGEFTRIHIRVNSRFVGSFREPSMG